MKGHHHDRQERVTVTSPVYKQVEVPSLCSRVIGTYVYHERASGVL